MSYPKSSDLAAIAEQLDTLQTMARGYSTEWVVPFLEDKKRKLREYAQALLVRELEESLK